MKIQNRHLISLIGTILCCSFFSMAQDGEAIFKQNCTACHKLGQRLVGPDLIGVHEKRSEEWLIKFIKSSQSLIKSGDPDAIAIFEEYNQLIMIDQNQLSDDQIKSVILYIKENSPSTDALTGADQATPPAEIIPIEYSEADVENGRHLFSGIKRFSNGGPSCISCHNVNNNQLIAGGLLAKDLTNVYARMGDAGLAGIIGAPPFPAMATSYKDNALDSTETAQLIAFLKHADTVSDSQEIKSGLNIFILGGGSGLICLLLIISIHWNKRLKKSVKNDIYSRQIKSI